MPAAGILYWKRSKYYRPILHNSKSHETSRSLFLEYIKNIGRRKYQRGATSQPQAWRAPPTLWAPWQASSAHLWLYGVFYPRKKNQEEAFGTKRRRLEAEPGQNQSMASVELFYRGNIPPGGGNHRHRHHHRSSH